MKPRSRRGVRWALAVLVVALLGGGWWLLEAFTGEAGSWAAVERDDLTLKVEVTGSLRAVDTDLIGPPKLPEIWQYKIAFMAPEGQTVAEGERVLGFDASELEQRLQQEIANRDAARKRVEKAEREAASDAEQDGLKLSEAEARMRKAALKIERPGEVVAAREQAVFQLDLDLCRQEVDYLRARLESSRHATEAYLASLRYQLAQAEQEVRETQSSIESMARKSTRPGTVIYVKNWREEKKSVGDTAWRGEDVIELPDLSRMKAMGQVHEADAGRLVEGQKVRFRLDSHPDLEFTGRVAHIWRTVQRESWRSPLKVVRVEIELDETDTRKMRPGMRLRGTIEVERVPDALLVDADAVFLETDGPVAYRQSWRGVERIPLELGRRDDDEVEVLSGLGEGDLVSLVRPAGRRGAT